MALRPWVKVLINELAQFPVFDVDDGRRHQPSNVHDRLQDSLPHLDDLWQDVQEVEVWIKDKIEEIACLDISDEEKTRKAVQVLYMAYCTAMKAWGDDDIPTPKAFRDFIRPRFAEYGISI
jgi:hypothetical protein